MILVYLLIILLITALVNIIYSVVHKVRHSRHNTIHEEQFHDPNYITRFYGDNVYYINMDHRPERREHIENNVLGKLGIKAERISGVKGDSEDALKMPNGLRPGEKGCYLSHRKIAKKFLEKGGEWALIFEDDAALSHGITQTDFEAVMSTALRHYPDVEILLFGSAYREAGPCKYCITKDNLAKLSHAYAMSKDAAKKLVQEPLETITAPIDWWDVRFDNVVTVTYNGMNGIVHQTDFGNSDVAPRN